MTMPSHMPPLAKWTAVDCVYWAKTLRKDFGVPVPYTEDDVKRLYRRLAKNAHPDRGGRPDQFAAVVAMRDTMMATVGVDFEVLARQRNLEERQRLEAWRAARLAALMAPPPAPLRPPPKRGLISKVFAQVDRFIDSLF